MIIIKTIRAGQQHFGPGQEAQLIEYAQANPDQLDFLRLLELGCIDQIPDMKDLTPEEQEAKRLKLEQEELAKIAAANARAEQALREEQERIEAARARAELAKAKQARQAKVDQAENDGEGAE